jgi:hypothetical protein
VWRRSAQFKLIDMLQISLWVCRVTNSLADAGTRDIPCTECQPTSTGNTTSRHFFVERGAEVTSRLMQQPLRE